MKNQIFKILAIDDIPDNLISVKALINEAFPESNIFTALNGKQGLELALAEIPDVILLDILMPGMDGFEVCRLLKAKPELNDIPVVFTTALKDGTENRIAALDAGAEGFLTKPIDVTELTAQIRAMLKIRSASLKIRDEKTWFEQQIKSRTIELQNELNERKKAEEALRRSEEKFREVFEAANIGKSITSVDGKIFVNKAFSDMLGYSREELQNKKWQEITPPQDIDNISQKIKYIVDHKIDSTRFNKQYIHKNGSLIWCDVSISLQRDKSGNLLYYITTVVDINDRVKAEVALIESEAQIKSIFRASPVGIGLLKNRTICEVNDYFCRLTGYSNEELIGQNSRILYPSDEDYKYVGTEKYHQIKEFGTGTVETRFITKSGEIRHILLSSTPVNPANLSEGITFTVLDITERKRAEKALQYASENWNTTFRSINSGVLLLDSKQRIVQSNKSFQEFTGKTAAELYQNHCFEHVHGTDCPGDNCPFVRMKTSKQREILEIKLKERDYELIVDPILNEKNEITGAVHILNDISQRKKDEKIQNVLFEIARISLASKDLEKLLVNIRTELHKIIDTTNFFVALHNVKSNKLTKVIFADEKDDFSEWDADHSLSGYVVKTGNSLLLDKNESDSFYAVNRINPMGSAAQCWLGVPLKINNKSIGVMVVQSYTNLKAYDLNSVRLLEIIANELAMVIERNIIVEDLVNARDKAEESDRLKSAFLANMSHEIRTPMNGILGFTNLLDEPDLTEIDKKYYISVIKKSGDRLLNTVNDLIEISKIETGQMKLIPAVTNINDHVSNLYQLFKPQAIEKNIQFLLKNKISVTDSIVKTDVGKFDSILTNLIKNAIKYTDEGFIEIGCYSENGYLHFYVKDTGIGIPSNRHEAVFKRFEQADIFDRRAYQGSGLGLSIAKAFVEMMGGEITLDSIPGKGSTFSFYLPLNKTNNIQNQKLITDKSNNGENKSLHKLIIAIAEDDDSSLLYLKTILKNINTEFIYCANGVEAVEKCRENPDIDIFLMDLRMPVLDGYEAIHQIREFNKEVVIIAQTAYALAGDKEKALAAGCNDYISKPLKRDELIGLINKYHEF